MVLANESEGILLVRPSVRAIKNINWRFLGLLRGHDLDEHLPRRVVSLLDGVEEVFQMVVWICPGQADSGVSVHCFDAVGGLKMPLDIYVAPVLIVVSLIHI